MCDPRDTEFAHLHALADQVLAALDDADVGGLLLVTGDAYEPTIYSQCGNGCKPGWPPSAVTPFRALWAHL